MDRKRKVVARDSDTDEDQITIEHLLGNACVLNSTINVTLQRKEKSRELILSTGPASFYYVVIDVLELLPNGGYKVVLQTPRGKKMSDAATLIKRSLWKPEKGAVD